jgi:hypothetical protein
MTLDQDFVQLVALQGEFAELCQNNLLRNGITWSPFTSSLKRTCPVQCRWQGHWDCIGRRFNQIGSRSDITRAFFSLIRPFRHRQFLFGFGEQSLNDRAAFVAHVEL